MLCCHTPYADKKETEERQQPKATVLDPRLMTGMGIESKVANELGFYEKTLGRG